MLLRSNRVVANANAVLSGEVPDEDVVARSSVMVSVMRDLERLAATDLPVFVHGDYPTNASPSRKSFRQRARSGEGTDSHSLKTFPAGANGCPTPVSISSATRSRGSFTTRPEPL